MKNFKLYESGMKNWGKDGGHTEWNFIEFLLSFC